MQFTYNKKTSVKPRLVFLITTAFLLILCAVLGSWLYATHRTPTRMTTESTSGASQSTKGDVNNSPNPTTPVVPTNDDTTPSNKQSTAQTSTLIQPTGDFVSNHKNVAMTASLSSVCNTTSGATCQITFTQGTTTHSLPAQTTDLGGTTYWNSWTPPSIGLTPGTWQVTANATLAGVSKSSTDSLGFEVVQP